MGWVKTADLEPELMAAVRRLEKDETSYVIETEKAFCLVKLVDKRGLYIQPLAQAWDLIRSELEKKEYARVYGRWMQDLKNKAYIKIVGK